MPFDEVMMIIVGLFFVLCGGMSAFDSDDNDKNNPNKKDK